MIKSKEEYYSILERLRTLNFNQKLGRNLQAKLEAFEEMEELVNLTIPVVTNWVAVNKRLPAEQTDVITYSKEFEVRNGRCMQKGSWFVNGYSRLVNVTHWAELPKPPCL